MDEIRCSIEVREVEGKPARLTGVIMPYGERARDRAEIFERGSLSWAAGGIVLNRMHRRDSPILRFTPIEADGKLTLDVEIPLTAAGADARAEIKSGLLTGMSVEFTAVRESVVGGIRRIASAVLSAAALVDEASYQGAVVEARAKAERDRDRHTREFLL